MATNRPKSFTYNPRTIQLSVEITDPFGDAHTEILDTATTVSKFYVTALSDRAGALLADQAFTDYTQAQKDNALTDKDAEIAALNNQLDDLNTL